MINKKALQAPTPVRFSEEGGQQLDAVVQAAGTTRSDVIRKLVSKRYKYLKTVGVIK